MKDFPATDSRWNYSHITRKWSFSKSAAYPSDLIPFGFYLLYLCLFCHYLYAPACNELCMIFVSYSIIDTLRMESLNSRKTQRHLYDRFPRAVVTYLQLPPPLGNGNAPKALFLLQIELPDGKCIFLILRRVTWIRMCHFPGGYWKSLRDFLDRQSLMPNENRCFVTHIRYFDTSRTRDGNLSSSISIYSFEYRQMGRFEATFKYFFLLSHAVKN